MIWDAKSGEAVGEPLGPAAKIGLAQDVTFSPDASTVLVAAVVNPDGQGGAAVAWRVSDGKELFTLNIDDGYGRGGRWRSLPTARFWRRVEGPGRSSSGRQDGCSSQGSSLLTGTAGWVLALDFDLTSERLVSTGSDGVTRHGTSSGARGTAHPSAA